MRHNWLASLSNYVEIQPMLSILTQTIILQIAFKLQDIMDLYRRGREGDSQ